MVGPSMPDAEKVAAVREALPAVGAGIYLNAADAGPLPAETAAAMAEIAEWDLRTGRAHRDRRDDVEGRLEEARAAVAAILTTDLDDVALTRGTAEGLARAVRLADWSAGGRIVMVNDPALAEVPSLAPPGVTVTLAEPEEIHDAITRPGVRLVALPLVSGASGARLPVDAIAARAHEAGALVLVDASLAVGAVPVDPIALGADALVARSECWLLGPEGLGILAAADAGRQQPMAGFHLPAVVGFGRGCGWLSMYIGLPWIHARGAALADRAAQRLAGIEGVTLRTPDQRATTLILSILGWTADEALDELGRRIFLIAGRAVSPDAIRLSVGFWNTDEELERLAGAIELLAAHTPETLPRLPRLTMLGESPS